MKYKGTLVVVKDCRRALRFYQDLFGFELIRDNDGNMELSGGLYLQEQKYWERVWFSGTTVQNCILKNLNWKHSSGNFRSCIRIRCLSIR